MKTLKKELISTIIGKITITFILPLEYANQLEAKDNDLFECYLDGSRIIIEKLYKNEIKDGFNLSGECL